MRSVFLNGLINVKPTSEFNIKEGRESKIILICTICINIILIFFPFHGATSQEFLTLENAVKIGLENNYDIRISTFSLEVDRNNLSLANSGILPLVTADLNDNNSIMDTRIVRSTGEINEANNARNSSINYGVNLRWTVFDGFEMFARHRQLKELENLSEANLQLTVLSRLNEIYQYYFGLIQLQQQLRAFKTTLEISKFRVQTSRNRYLLGKASKLEILNTQVDFNADTTSFLKLSEQYENTQTLFNEILARDLNTRFTVADTINIDTSLNLDSLESLALAQNPTLKSAALQTRIAELELQRVKGRRYPVVNLISGYNFSKSQSALGFATQTSGKGFTIGVGATVNLFNGFLQNRMENNAKIQISNAEIARQKLNQNILAQLYTAFQTYQTNLILVQLERENVNIAKQNLDITLEKFRLGSISTLEMREAQQNYTNAIVRFSEAQYQAKLAEVSLKNDFRKTFFLNLILDKKLNS